MEITKHPAILLNCRENLLIDRYYGGWVAENIYYLGKCGVISVNGFRIAGVSGIYKPASYWKGLYESLPLNEDEIRTIYHTREYEIMKMALIEQQVDIAMSHDWPAGAVNYGNVDNLLRFKPHFEEDVKKFGVAFRLITEHLEMQAQDICCLSLNRMRI